jgi:hypothetical protein
VRTAVCSGAGLCALALAGCGRGVDSDTDAATIPSAVEELGPYRVADVDYTVELTAIRSGDDESVVRMRIIDGSGAVHVDESYDAPAAAGPGLESTLAVVPWVIEGESGSALLLVRESLPAAPMTGETVQLYAPRGGRLTALTAPLAPYGEFVALRTGADGVRRLGEGDVMQVELWRYHFGATVPLAFDLSCEPHAEACVAPAPAEREPMSGYGVYRISTDRRDLEEDGFVTMHEAPGSELFDRVPVRRDSSIEVIEAAIDIELRAGTVIEIAARDEWLRVRIDGVEGWISTPESFERIGLPGAG